MIIFYLLIEREVDLDKDKFINILKMRDKPKFVYQNILPLGNKFVGITLYPYVFLKKRIKKYGEIEQKYIRNHESIHFEQQKDYIVKYNVFIGLLVFYSLYIFWWAKYGYRKIPFELEAYTNEYNFNYIDERKPLDHLKYKK